MSIQKNVTVQENETGVSYYRLFADYLKGARRISMQDPYIRKPYQIKNLIEFIQVRTPDGISSPVADLMFSWGPSLGFNH